MARAYFTLDLTPETLIDGAIRMGVASVFSLVASFALVSAFDEGAGVLAGLLPVTSFVFGFFPKRALAFLEQSALTLMKGLSSTAADTVPLSALHGISYSHQLRLEREGFDNAENLSQADPVDLAIRTGFSYRQLHQWIEEAWLAIHLRDDYAAFVRRTGITSRDELARYFSRTPPCGEFQPLSADAADQALRAKLMTIRNLIAP